MKEIFHAEEKYEFSDNVGRINCVFFFFRARRELAMRMLLAAFDHPI